MRLYIIARSKMRTKFSHIFEKSEKSEKIEFLSNFIENFKLDRKKTFIFK